MITNNVMSGNHVGAELMSSLGSTLLHDVFRGNFVGTERTGRVALGNSQGGIVFTRPVGDPGGNGNLIGDRTGTRERHRLQQRPKDL
jgi:hypothetical protein